MKKINIAIDGYSSTGKSTLARELAAQLKYRYIDTGAMYRAVALYLRRKGIGQADLDQVFWTDLLADVKLAFKLEPGSDRAVMYLNGEKVEKEIRQRSDVLNLVSHVATVSEVRQFLVEQQRQMSHAGGVVMDGRDIGTVVLPQAELKIFMTAEPDIRVQRRFEELRAKGGQEDWEAAKANLQERDYVDSHRADSPLRQAEDAILLDNSRLTPQEQLEITCGWARERIDAATPASSQ